MDQSSRLKAVTFFLALAFLVGPVAAACGTCCPESAPESALIAPAGCCGDCEPTVERSPDPASLTSKSIVAPSDAHAVLVAPAAGSPSFETTTRVVVGNADRACLPRVAPSPLRL
jgi:hypothetical protein